MRILICAIIFFIHHSTWAGEFPRRVKLCTYLLIEKAEKFLMFNPKTRSQVVIKLRGKKLNNLDYGPYLFDLKILNPAYQQNEYQAEIVSVAKCRQSDVVRFVDGELKQRK